jgi:hypothetical protein
MPRSKTVENDPEAEIYSVSMTHQLHCLVDQCLDVICLMTKMRNREYCEM